MNYDQALAYIHSLPRFAPQPGLDNMRSFLRLLGEPQRGPRYVHIAGTNGKGSTTAMVASILRCAGYRTGTYTSPHLERFEERIAVGGEPISPQDLVRLTGRMRQAAGALAAQQHARREEHGRTRPHGQAHGLIEFELITAMAFEHFRSAGCEMVALEVGLGGRFDATNVIDPPVVAVITSIGYDHVEILGPTLADIAREKAGIIKPGTTAVTAVRDPAALAVISGAARDAGVRLWTVARRRDAASAAGAPPCSQDNILWLRTSHDLDGQTFDVELPGEDAAYRALRTRLLGPHQLDNAACAVAAAHAVSAHGWPIGEAAVRQGLAEARWPGRFEILARRPYVILDGAHNPQGASALRETFEELFPDAVGRATLVLGVLGDKAMDSVVAALAPLAGRVIVTRPAHPTRALEPGALARAVSQAGVAEVRVREPVADALDDALQGLTGPDDVMIVTGSLYLTGEARRSLKHMAGAT